MLNRLVGKHGVRLRQSYRRIAKKAAMMAGRYSHAKQFKRHHRQLRLLKSRLGRIIREIHRKIEGRPDLEAAFAALLVRSAQIRSQQQRQRGWTLYSFHAPGVECIGKGRASAPYEFGVKASIVTTNGRAPGASSCSMPRHCQAIRTTAIYGRRRHRRDREADQMPYRTGLCQQGLSRPHNAKPAPRLHLRPEAWRLRCHRARTPRRRSAIEPITGHMKSDGHLGRCHLKGPLGRRHKRHPHRRRSQPLPRPRLARGPRGPQS